MIVFVPCAEDEDEDGVNVETDAFVEDDFELIVAAAVDVKYLL